MTPLSVPLPFSVAAALAGTGLASIGMGAARLPDTGLKPLGLALVAIALAASPARADQYIEAADNARIDCTLSRGELTRIALVEDGFANVSKIASGYPYNDFTVTHEPVRGDIYVSVPPQFAADRISFFATSKHGFVYKFACTAEPVEASQIFITNPALAKTEAQEWEHDSGPGDAAIRLIEAMASGAVLPGYQMRQEIGRPTTTDGLEVQQIAQYSGAALSGQHFVMRNRGKDSLALGATREAPVGAVAFAYGADTLEPGETTNAFLVFQAGGPRP